MLKTIRIFCFVVFLSALTTSMNVCALEKSDQVRLHVLDCGNIEITDASVFSDTGEYDGKQAALKDPCFLVQHPSGSLLWDTGLNDAYVLSGPEVSGPFHFSVTVTLKSQLEKLGVAPGDIAFVGFSHTHRDHVGNADQFMKSTWLWQEKELASFLTKGPAQGIRPELLGAQKKAPKHVFSGDYDVFGDGKVKILSTPGHTPGHQSLLIKLESGPIILTGDLYHLRANREHERVPSFNFSRAETLASMHRIETLAKNLKARVIVQHDPQEYASLPKFPKYLH